MKINGVEMVKINSEAEFNRNQQEYEEQVGTRLTTSELELLIKIAASHQRDACVEAFSEKNPEWMGIEAAMLQNTKCPDVSKVLAEWWAMIGKEENE